MIRSKLVVAAMLLAAVSIADAAPDAKAESQVHIDAATKAHAAGDFDTALVELQAAYALDPVPDLLYAIGQVYSKLGKCTDASIFFKKFGVAKHDPNVRSVVSQAIAACKPQGPTTAVVKPPPTPPPHEPTPVVVPAPAVETSPFYTDVLGDALVGAGVASSVVGLVFYLGARSKLDDAESAASLAAYNGLVSDAHSERTRAGILLGAGGALVIAGVVRYLMRSDAPESSTVAVVPATGGGLVTWGGSF